MISDAGYRAARETAAVFDRSARGKIAVAGSDRKTYLHAMLTNDVAALEAGQGCYAAFLTPQGRMIADLRVLELGGMTLLDLHPSVTAATIQRLDAFIFSEDVRLGDLTEAFGQLSVVGPAAARVVAAALGGGAASPSQSDLEGWVEFQNVRTGFRDEMVALARSTESGAPGFDLYVERPIVGALADALVEAGAAAAGPQVAEVVRIESGRPAFGADMDGDTIPLEAGIEDRAISFTKGCYPGQEVIIRVIHRGQGRVARKLAGLVVAGNAVPEAGDRLHAGDREAGLVTSAAWSPLMSAPVAIAMIQRAFLEPGTELEIAHGDTRLSARVAALPFHPSRL